MGRNPRSYFDSPHRVGTTYVSRFGRRNVYGVVGRNLSAVPGFCGVPCFAPRYGIHEKAIAHDARKTVNYSEVLGRVRNITLGSVNAPSRLTKGGSGLQKEIGLVITGNGHAHRVGW